MKSLQTLLTEAMVVKGTSKVYGGDTANLKKYMLDNIEGLEEKDFKISTAGVTDLTDVRHQIIPNTKLSGTYTFDQIVDTVIDYFSNKEEMKTGSLRVKKSSKAAGVPRGSYGAKEKADARAAERNRAVINGTDREINKSYLNN